MKNTSKDNLTFIKKRIAELVEQINFWNYEYYDLDFPSVSDAQYDETYQELVELENLYPALVRKNSPTQKVGGTSSNKFVKFTHAKAMLSLNKAYSIEDVIKFDSDVSKITLTNHSYSLEPKIDGLSISLHYQNGMFVRAVTRGDGEIGEVVTDNIKQIQNIPLTINYNNDLEIRGEVYLSKHNYNVANEKIKIEHYFNLALKNLKNLNTLLENNLLTSEYKNKILELINKITNTTNSNLSLEDLKTITQEINHLISQNTFVDFSAENNAPKLFANPRNAASGTLRQLDLNVVKQRNLDYFVYEVVDPNLHGINSQIKALEFLKDLGFVVNEYIYQANSIEDVISKITDFKDIKATLPYDCDGFVIKVNEMKFWDQLGFTSKFPKYAIAFKYETEEAITKIVDISAEVGRTGKITYLAKLEPVQLNQTTVSAATLHNYEYVLNMNLNVGDLVKVIKSGEIIPKVIALVQKNTTQVFPKILHCPSCNSLLQQNQDLVDQFCVNENCNEKIIRALIHFASRDAMNIMDLGEENIRMFYKEKLLNNILDIYNLHQKRELLETLPKIGKRKVQKLIASVEKSKQTTLAKALFAIGIKTIGSQVAELITQEITQLSNLITLNLDKLTQINTIGNTIVENLRIFVQNPQNQELLRHLDSLLTYEKINKTNKLQGLTFVITGTLSQGRDYYKNLIVQNGAKVSSSVSSNTSYVLAGENAGSKLDKAIALNVKIINEEQFNELIK